MVRSSQEHKFLDSVANLGPATAAVAITNAGKLIPLVDVQQGITDSERIGDKVRGTSLEFRLVSFPAEVIGVTAKFWMCRITIFIWKDDSVPVDLTDIYSNAGITGIAANQPSIWPYNHDKRIKRKILADWTFTQFLDGNETTYEGVQDPYYQCQKIIPLARLKNRVNEIHYEGNTTTAYNKIYVLLSSNQPDFATTWNVAMWTRFNYVDA